MTLSCKMISILRVTISGSSSVSEMCRKGTPSSSILSICPKDTHFFSMAWNLLYSRWLSIKEGKLDGSGMEIRWTTRKVLSIRGSPASILTIPFPLSINFISMEMLSTSVIRFPIPFRISAPFYPLLSLIVLAVGKLESDPLVKLWEAMRSLFLNSPTVKVGLRRNLSGLWAGNTQDKLPLASWLKELSIFCFQGQTKLTSFWITMFSGSSQWWI